MNVFEHYEFVNDVLACRAYSASASTCHDITGGVRRGRVEGGARERRGRVARMFQGTVYLPVRDRLEAVLSMPV